MGCSFLTTLAISVVVVAGGLATEPKLITPCSCRYQNLTYDLSPLARTDGKPRFTLNRDNYLYAYNPCLPFNLSAKVKLLGGEYNCINVAICSMSVHGPNPLGYHSKDQVTCKASDQSIALVFKQGGLGKNLEWKTTVELICNKTALDVNRGLRIKATGREPVFQIVSKYSCSRESPQKWSTLQIAKKLPNMQQFVYLIVAIALGVLLFISIVVIVTVCVKNRRLRQDNRRQDYPEGNQLLRHDNEALNQNLEENVQLQQEDEPHPGEVPVDPPGDDVLHNGEAERVNGWPGNERQINEGGIQNEINELPEENDHVNDLLGEEVGDRPQGQPRPGNLPAAEVDGNVEEVHPELLGEDERRNELNESQVNDPQGQPRARNQQAENVEEDHPIFAPKIQPEGEEANDRPQGQPRNQPVERDE